MATQPPATKKSSLSISRIVLLLILVSALGALGFDQYSKYRMGRAYDTVEAMARENEDSSVQGLPKEKIHAELGEPTRTSLTPDKFQQVEEYDYPGVFYVHRMIIKYRNMKTPLYDNHDRKSIFRISAE